MAPRAARATLIVVALLNLAAATAAAPKPHILTVLVDDWGFANAGWHRTPADDPEHEVQTPTMDALVAEGIELNQTYAFWYCAPSRAALQSGRNPIHVCINNDDSERNHNPADPVSGFAGIPRNMTTIGVKMREAGYKTHYYGKWRVRCRVRASMRENRTEARS